MVFHEQIQGPPLGLSSDGEGPLIEGGGKVSISSTQMQALCVIVVLENYKPLISNPLKFYDSLGVLDISATYQ